MMKACIFCKKENQKPSIEHIVPFSLGNDEDALKLVDGEVCQTCNSSLGSKDESFVRRLDFFRIQAGITNYKGNYAKLVGKNFNVERSNSEIIMRVDMSSNEVPFNGEHQFDKKGDEMHNYDTRLNEDRSISTGYRHSLRFDSGMSRGLYKIAFEFLCKQVGRAYVLDERWDKLRQYILGANHKIRDYIIIAPKTIKISEISGAGGINLFKVKGTDLIACRIQIGFMSFVVPLEENKGNGIFILYKLFRNAYQSHELLVKNYSIALPKPNGKMRFAFDTASEVKLGYISLAVSDFLDMVLNDALEGYFLQNPYDLPDVSTAAILRKHLKAVLSGDKGLTSVLLKKERYSQFLTDEKSNKIYDLGCKLSAHVSPRGKGKKLYKFIYSRETYRRENVNRVTSMYPDVEFVMQIVREVIETIGVVNDHPMVIASKAMEDFPVR